MMEGFEHLVKIAMEEEGLVVTGPLKFKVARQTKKKNVVEIQEHGYEVDLVGARHNLLVLASVKSFFGSKGVMADGFRAISTRPDEKHFGAYRVFNDQKLRDQMMEKASDKFGYPKEMIEVRLYAGKFYRPADKKAIEDLLSATHAGRGPMKVCDVEKVLEKVMSLAKEKTYFNDPVVVLLKALNATGRLR